MKTDLYQTAKAYVAVIEKIEKTSDPKKLQLLEEKRVELHWQLIDLLKREGIQFKDREDATRIAFKIANEEWWV